MNNIKIRQVKLEDLERIAEIEVICFPPLEAASKETLKERMLAFPNSFFVAEKEGEIIGFINGCATDSYVIFDELYHDASLHKPDGENLVVFGLNVVPEYQRQGIAAQLVNYYIESAKNYGHRRVILTCKEHLIHYYEYFSFINGGISSSTHGGSRWYNMTLEL